MRYLDTASQMFLGCSAVELVLTLPLILVADVHQLARRPSRRRGQEQHPRPLSDDLRVCSSEQVGDW